MGESETPKRRGRPPTTGISPKRSLRVADELWNDVVTQAAAEGVEVAGMTRDFYAWWLRRPGAKLPKRPEPRQEGPAMDRLAQRRAYADAYRAALRDLGAYREGPHVLKIAREWMESGVDAGQAAQWNALGYLPGEAAPLIADGMTPDMADELDALADDIAGGPDRRAADRIDQLVADGVLIDPARVRQQVDPDDPTHIIVHIDDGPEGR